MKDLERPNPEPNDGVELQGNDEPKRYSDDEIQKILSTSKKVREERRALEARLQESNKALEKLKTLDPEKYNAALQRQQELEEAANERQILYSQRQTQWDQERSQLTSTIGSLREEMQELTIKHTLENAFYANGGRRGADDYGQTCFDVIYPQMRRFIQLSEDGKMEVVDPRDKQPLLTEKGERKTVKDIIAILRENEVTMAMFQADNTASGMGTGTNKTSKRTPNDIKLDPNLSRSDRLSILRAQK